MILRKRLCQAVKFRFYSSTPKLPECEFQPQNYKGISYQDASRIRKLNINPAIPNEKPLMITQANKQWIFDETGKRYLDMFAGIVTVSVGHCHPKVVSAAYKQMQTLWHSSTVYWQPTMLEYAEKLVKRLPPELNVCYFTNSGAEANDLAMMMARLYTGRFDMITFRNAYHGVGPYTMGLTANSKWKQNFANSFGVHHAMNPDVYRGLWGGKHCRDSPSQTCRSCDCDEKSCLASDNYLQQMDEVIQYSLPNQKFAAFFVEPIQGVGGITQYPKNYLKSCFELARKHGAVCIADEVQTGFGRTGDHFWGFESNGVKPDIVTMAKGIANGFPMGAVVTTKEIAQSLSNSIHLNTFGGNPIACSSASAVLDVIDEENLQHNCKEVGTYLIQRLSNLRDEFEVVGDVRGKGLMIGVELVTDKKSRNPLPPKEFAAIWENCREMGVLLGRGGYNGNVFRIQPPMCITKTDADFCVDVLKHSLQVVKK